MRKIKTRYIILISAVVITGVIGVVIINEITQFYSQFEIKVEKVKFNDKWLNFTICFVKLPEQGVEFDEIIVDGYKQSLKGITFYTGDRLTIQIPHNGAMQSIPETATLWLGENGFIIKLNVSADYQ